MRDHDSSTGLREVIGRRRARTIRGQLAQERQGIGFWPYFAGVVVAETSVWAGYALVLREPIRRGVDSVGQLLQHYPPSIVHDLGKVVADNPHVAGDLAMGGLALAIGVAYHQIATRI